MANLADDDLLLVQRTSAGISTNYSITGSALKEDLTGVTGLIANPVEVLTPLDGSGLSGDISYYPETSTITTVEAVSGGGTAVAAASNSWYDITYGDGKYVAISYDGTYRVMYSTDAINWSTATAAQYFWLSVTYADNKFVAVGASGDHRVMYSSNGINWTTVEAAQKNTWRSITYGNGKYVAVSSNGNNRVQYSTTGTQNWGNGYQAEDNDWYGVAYGDNVFVAVARNGTYRVMTSNDGINWSNKTAAAQETWLDVAYGNGKFVAVADSGSYRAMWSSNSGNNWNAVAPEASNWRSVTYGNGKFVAVASYGTNRIMWADESDLDTWYPVAAPEQNSWESVTYGNGKFVATSTDGTNRIMYSPDGVDWSSGDSTTLTLTNDKVFDSSSSNEMSTVDQVLTEGAIVDGTGGSIGPKSAFSATTYTGNSGDQTITTGIDNTGKSLIWIKNRSENFDHLLTVNQNKWLSSNNTNQAYDLTSQVTAFNSDGFSVSSNTVTNDNNRNYVAWNFRALPGFFDIQTWTGNETVRTIAHDLGSVPGMIMVKQIDTGRQWFVYHKHMQGGAYDNMNLDGTFYRQQGVTMWNNTEPTDTHFTVGISGGVNNNNGQYIAYIFADDLPGVLKCGSLNVNYGSGLVDVGFRPGFVLFKNMTGYSDWYIDDGVRNPSGSNSDKLITANSNSAESTQLFNEMYSTGFNPKNVVDGDYIYVAIAENATVNVPAPSGVLTADADASTPSINLTDVTGNWENGMTAVGRTQLTEYAPGPDDITFTSMNAGTTPFTGSDATLAFRRWTLESRSSAGDPWTVVDTYEDYDITASQDGATPWSSNKPTLTPNTMYRVKVAYISTNADPVESVYNTFTTGSN